MLSLEIKNPHWQPLITISQGSILQKGRKNDWYKAITSAAEGITASYGCYSWQGMDVVHYCGSFSPYSRHSTGLKGRAHNYLQNHRIKETGQINTNLMVFNNINQLLQTSSVTFAYFSFESLSFAQKTIDFAAFSNSPLYKNLVEEMLITYYSSIGEAAWNRTIKASPKHS